MALQLRKSILPQWFPMCQFGFENYDTQKRVQIQNFYIVNPRKLHKGKTRTELFCGYFEMTLQLMRFQSQNLYQVKSLLSDVRKIKKGSWKSCCFKQLFLPSVV